MQTRQLLTGQEARLLHCECVESMQHVQLHAKMTVFSYNRWRRGNWEIKLMEQPDEHYSLVGGNLVITNPSKKHAGTYMCVAKNIYGTVISKEAKLKFGCKHFIHCIQLTVNSPLPFRQNFKYHSFNSNELSDSFMLKGILRNLWPLLHLGADCSFQLFFHSNLHIKLQDREQFGSGSS